VGLGYRKDALIIFILLAFVFAYFSQDSGANGNSRFDLIFAVVHQGRLNIDSYHDQPDTSTIDKSFYNGHYYSDKDIGTAFFGTLVYLPLVVLERLFHFHISLAQVKYLLTFIIIGIPSAFAGSLMYVLAKFITGSRFRAFIVTMAIVLGTISFPFSLVFFGHQLAASLLFIAFFLIYQLKVRPELYKAWYQLLIGLVLGFALITDYTTAFVVLALSLYYLYVIWNRQSQPGVRNVTLLPAIAFPTLAGAFPVAILLTYNTLAFGSPFSIGYDHLTDPVFRAGMSQGIAGVSWPQLKVLYYLTINPAIGLFWQSPVLLMALVGFYFMVRERHWRAEAVLVAFAFIYYLMINSGYYMWWGGWSSGPRILIPMLPFLSLPLIFVPRRLFFIVVILTVVSFLQMVIISASQVLVPDEQSMQKINKFSFFGYSAIYSYCLPQLLKGKYAWNLGQAVLGLQYSKSLIPLLLAVFGAAGVFLVKEPSFTAAIQARAHFIGKQVTGGSGDQSIR
jgi:hypothetical protein